MSKTIWKPTPRIERGFYHAIMQYMAHVEKRLAGVTSTAELSRIIADMASASSLEGMAIHLSQTMITHSLSWTAKTWRDAAAEAGKGREIGQQLGGDRQGRLADAINWQISRNAGIIRTLPLNVSQRVVNRIDQLTLQGLRPEQIASLIQQMFPQYTRASAQLIARTEVSKTMAAINRAQSEDLGLEWYIWHTAGDSRARDSHDILDDVICRWADPPSPELLAGEPYRGRYHPGEIYNCRCYAESIIDTRRISWPHKVYISGKIKTMSRQSFERLSA